MYGSSIIHYIIINGVVWIVLKSMLPPDVGSGILDPDILSLQASGGSRELNRWPVSSILP